MPPADWDFFGVVTSVEFEGPRVENDGLSRGGPESDYLSEAVTITIGDGRSIAVPAGTPGGNTCRYLAVSGARNQECVIARRVLAALVFNASVESSKVLDAVRLLQRLNTVFALSSR